MTVAIIAVMVVIMGAGIMIVLSSNKPKKDQEASKQRMITNAYKFFSNFFLTQGQMMKISAQLSALSIYSKADIQALATKYLLMTDAISVGLVVASFFLFQDVISMLICVAFACLINNVLVTKQIDKVNLQVYKALKYTLSSIRQEYLRLGSVPEAIAEADIHPMLRKPFDEIYQILTSANGELRLLKFYESSPFRTLQTLAGVCYNINNSGDERDEFGQSNFVNALTMITSEVNSEIQRIITMKQKFGVIEYLTLAPIVAMRPIELYFASIMPGTALIYNGLLGYLCRIVTLLACIACYMIVSNVNSVTPIKEDDRAVWTINLLKNPKFRQFIYDITPKNAKARRAERKLKSALSRKTLENLYCEKIVWSFAAFFIALAAAATMVSLGRDFTMNSTQQLSLVATDEMEAYSKEQILQLDYMYFNRDREWSETEFQSTVQSMLPGLTDLQVLDQVKRIKDKEAALNAAYFHWYYMLIVIAVSCLAWKGPDILILIRMITVQTEAEDDFLQLQTLMAILMNLGIDTLDALWQMTQHSRIHKSMLMWCYHSYPSNPEKELVRLQSKTPILEFKRFIGKLQLTISDLSLAEAYSDLKIERDHMIRVKEINMYATIDKKRSMCGPVSMAPLACCVVGELLIPLGYLGIKEFMSALGSMG